MANNILTNGTANHQDSILSRLITCVNSAGKMMNKIAGPSSEPASLTLCAFIARANSKATTIIAKITTASGLKGEVNLRPLIRQFQDYVSNDLYVGFDKSVASDIKIANVSGSVNKPRFHFEGLHSRNDAEAMIGKLLFASVNKEDPINLISPDLIGASVISNNGKNIGTLVDMMSLPAHDVYVISNSNNKKVLIPVVPEFIESVDYDSQNVIISPIEGLF